MRLLPRMPLGLVVLLALALPSSALAGAQPAPIPHGRALAALAAEPRVLLGVERTPEARRALAAQGAAVVSPALGIWEVTGAEAARLVPQLERQGALRHAEPVYTREPLGQLGAADPLLSRAWHLERVGVASATPPSPRVPLTILDTGLDVSNPDFDGRPDLTLLNEQFAGGFGGSQYHGTVVASTAGAAANGVGTVGVFPTAALRIFDLPSLDDPTIIRSLDEVATGGVVNLSIGGPGYSRSLYEAVLRVVKRGGLVVAAAGNHYHAGNPDIYPADYPHVLTVAATDQADRPLFFSSGNQAVDVAAPGADIPVQDPDDAEGFATYDGTSFAAPVVSAVAAWIWSARPSLDPTQVFELVRRTARDTAKNGFDGRTGFGVVSLPRALAATVPIVDPGEPNDDVDLIRSPQILGAPTPPLTDASDTSATLRARLDAVEDPHDVYKVFVPAKRRVEITVTPTGKADVALWNAATESVTGLRRNRLALSAKAGSARERIVWRNTAASGVVAFVDVRLPGGRGGQSSQYVLRVRVR